MQFQLCVIDDGVGLATPEEMEAISAFNERMADAGQRVLAGGLASPSESIMVDHRGSSPIVTQESLMPELPYYAGFWVVDVSDFETVRQLSIEASRACNRRIEIRRFLTREDIDSA